MFYSSSFATCEERINDKRVVKASPIQCLKALFFCLKITWPVLEDKPKLNSV